MDNYELSDMELMDAIDEKKRHKELIKALGALSSYTSNNSAITLAIENNNKTLATLTSVLFELLTAIKKQPDSSINFNEVIGSIENVANAISNNNKQLQSIEPKPTEWEFEIKRGNGNFIQSITAKAKT